MSDSTYLIPPTAEESALRRTENRLPAAAITFLDYVRPDLLAVEARMNEDIGSDVREVHALAHHVLNAGGKRLRPAMVALSARAIQPSLDFERIAVVGAAVEFVHMATLVHDDVVDNTELRRGQPTANAVFGNGVAVLSGDYLLARAMRLLALDGDLRIIRAVSEITIQMSEGEVLEILSTGKADLSMETYLEILRKKTAVFVEGCCRVGAMVAQAPPRLEAALADYGYRLGMAFQIADDLLDYTGDPALTGKPRGSDLRDGRATLPFLLAWPQADAKDRKTLLAAFGNPALDDEAVLSVCDILRGYDAFERARCAAREQVETAERALALLPPSTAKDCFTALTAYVVQRDR
jgi:octaprenyl-diphosphate synthase